MIIYWWSILDEVGTYLREFSWDLGKEKALLLLG